MQTLAELPFVGGHVALDFVNTAEQRGHPAAGDVLHSADDLRAWGERYGLLSAGVSGDGAELRRAVEARELLYSVLLARAGGRPPADGELERLAALALAACREGRLEPGPDDRIGWRWDPGRLSTVRHTVVTAAVTLLAEPPTPRLKQCPGDHCGWFFLDTTKRGNRRWCLMSECGQEAKSQRRRRRG